MIHPPGCECTTSYGCQLRRKGVQLSPKATPTRGYRLPKVLKPPEAPSWEAQVMGERTPDGSFSPYLNEHGDRIHIKEWSENRHTYESRLKQLRTPASAQGA